MQIPNTKEKKEDIGASFGNIYYAWEKKLDLNCTNFNEPKVHNQFGIFNIFQSLGIKIST